MSKDAPRTFAVMALGRERWYWVVWPGMADGQAEEMGGHVAEGVAANKLDAIDAALAVAGEQAQWLASGYARRYRSSRHQARAAHGLAHQEFLYYDVREPLPNGGTRWRSWPHRIVKRTTQYIYVAATPHDPAAPSGYWAEVAGATVRLDRASLVQHGYAFVGLRDADRFALEEPLFFTTPSHARMAQAGAQTDCFTQLELTPPYSVEAVKHAYRRLAMQHHPDRGGSVTQFLALQSAYRQALAILES